MKKSPYDIFKPIKGVLFAVVGVMTVLVLVLSALSHNVVNKTRREADYRVIEGAQVLGSSNGTQYQKEYYFTLENIEHAETLAFFVSHHDVQVYLDDECVYSVSSKDDMFHTNGGTWIMVPIYYEDEGKQVRVVLTQLYSNYVDDVEFLIGSEIALHNATLHSSLPAMILCLCVMFAGFLLICFAFYQGLKGISAGRLYALGIMALSAGMWRISYDKVAYLFFENSSVLIYNISIITLMLMALSMINSIEMNENNRKKIRIVSCCYCIVYIIQFILQILGIADLRQTLKAVHVTIIISAVVFIYGSIKFLFAPKQEKEKHPNYSWMLGVGVVVDLVLYYFGVSSVKMIFTLIAILFFAELEGVSLMFTYICQKNAFEELETQLALSRTTTMMSQIRSHFVFNILNAISGMCKYDPKMADDTIVRFARYLRNNIDIMEDDSNVSFETDLQHLEDYVALEQIRFGDKIEFYSDVEVSNFKIPPLIMQPVVENAIKHGVSKKQDNGTIILRTRDLGDKIAITVEDDGVGFDMAELDKEHSVGIRNIRFRLEQLVHGELNIQSEIGKGTIVTITIPKEEN